MKDDVDGFTWWTRSKGPVASDPVVLRQKECESAVESKDLTMACQAFDMEALLNQIDARLQAQLGAFKREIDQRLDAISLPENIIRAGAVPDRGNQAENPELMDQIEELD
ncbi:unnamed protein product [Linum trigynum]|uniref:Uncharacterized protein n=1 Tax=Linum trigynum TaxID=586398 RepID=A0AAV2FB97_9ROSI